MCEGTGYKAPKTGAAPVTWDYRGAANGLVGRGATTAEKLTGFGSAVIVTAIILGADAHRAEPVAATWWQFAILAVLAYDIAGGAVANMLNSCKRFYHSPPRAQKSAVLRMLNTVKLFTAIHAHPVVIALIFGGDWERSLCCWRSSATNSCFRSARGSNGSSPRFSSRW